MNSSGIEVKIVLREIEKAKLNFNQSYVVPENNQCNENYTLNLNDNNHCENNLNAIPLIEDNNIVKYLDLDNSNYSAVNNMSISFEVNEAGALVPITNSTYINETEHVGGTSQDLQLDTNPCNKENENIKINIISDVFIKPATRMSPVVKKHLNVPSPINKSSKINPSINRIGAISSKEWRDFEHKKAEEKNMKKNAILNRKLERIRIREEKLKQAAEKKLKLKNIKKRRLNRDMEKPGMSKRIKCTTCDEELVSDVEVNDLKNVGCDTCPSWYHMKCSKFAGKLYEEIKDESFVCEQCHESKD